MVTNSSQGTTVVLMGVSGSGKSTVAAELVRRKGWAFAEADDFHSAANVAKMHAGQALTDVDRAPWLKAIAEWIGVHEAAHQSAVVTCSALKRSYRETLRDGHPSVWFAYLDVPAAELAARVAHRPDHFMPASLLPSQLAAFEPLAADEPGATIDAAGPVATVADEVLKALARRVPSAG